MARSLDLNDRFFENEDGIYWFPINAALTARGAVRRLLATLRHEYGLTCELDDLRPKARKVFAQIKGERLVVWRDAAHRDDATEQLPQLFWEVDTNV